MNEYLAKLKGLGADWERSSYGDDAAGYLEQLELFVMSMDFMRLGQAISREQWQAASMKAVKMGRKAEELGMTGWEKQFTGIKQNVNRRNREEAQQILALLIAKRVKMIHFLKENRTNSKESGEAYV